MKAKKEYYKNYVDRKIRIRKLIYLVILFIAFLIVLYDSFIHKLPFHYILFFFIGRVMSLVMSKTLRLKKSEMDNKYTTERNIAGVLIVVAVIILRSLVFPKILSEFNIVFISDALFLILVGWFLGRINLLSGKIEEMVFKELLENEEK